MSDLIQVAAAVVFCVVMSCVLAQFAGGGHRTWAWGFVAPWGWIVAAIIGSRPLPTADRPRGTGAAAPRQASRTCGKCSATMPTWWKVCPSCGTPTGA